MQTLLRESQSAHFHHLNKATEGMMSDISTLQSTLNALRAVRPNIDASVTAHQFLLKHEGDTTRPLDVGEVCTVLQSLVQHQPVENGTNVGPSVNHSGLLRRLLDVLDHHRLNMTMLHLDGDTAHRLGLAASHLQRYEWAEGALGLPTSSLRSPKRARGLGTHRSTPGRRRLSPPLARGKDETHPRRSRTASRPRPPPGEHGRPGR